MRLSELKEGQKAIIIKVKGYGAFRKRIIEMGFVKGKLVKAVKAAPLKGPIEYDIMGYKILLRINEADQIDVISQEEAKHLLKEEKSQGTITYNVLKRTVSQTPKHINIAIVGNPNSGKTTLFNNISHSKEKTGNYGGVTITSKEATFKYKNYTFNITDLPGTYSISAYTPEELYVRKHIAENSPDIILNVLDASNIERNLYLTTQLIDMDLKVVSALNMYDELKKSQASLDYNALGEMLGIPIVPTISSKGQGLKTLFNKIIRVYEGKEKIVRHIHINYGQVVENSIKNIRTHLNSQVKISSKYSPRFVAIKLLEQDKDIRKLVANNAENIDTIKTTVKKEIEKAETYHDKTGEILIADTKYAFIAGALKQTLVKGKLQKRHTDKIDHWLIHKKWGFPLFVLFMLITFYATFTIGTYPQNWIDTLFQWIGERVATLMPEGTLKDLIINGILSGVGSVIVFLPNILILFFFISFMESTGYMARAAFIMDKLMQKVGLHGKAFIPLIMGFGCNVPAIMATRILENKRDRLIAILINPLMSCSARLPIYILVISAFFPQSPTLMLFSIYFIGIFLAMLMAKIFTKTLFKKQRAPFVMELPPYRMPTLKTIIIQMWHKAQQYLRKMGGLILIFSIIIWALWYYPKNIEYSQNYDTQIATNLKQLQTTTNDTIRQNYQEKIKQLEVQKSEEQQKNSYLGRLGVFIEPVLKPIGFDWKIGISLITGIAAKEVVVSTLGIIYNTDETEEKENALVERLKNDTNLEGNKTFTPLTAFLLLLFILIYAPCIAVIATIRHETGSLRWTLFGVFYTTVFAWLLCFFIYQLSQIF